MTTLQIDGVAWLLFENGRVLLEKCPKKALMMGCGEWFVPGGKLEGDEAPWDALVREVSEEWPGIAITAWTPLPIVQASRIPPGPKGIFLMQPYRIAIDGDVPRWSADGPELRWMTISQALQSPVAQVRMMVAAGMRADFPI